MTLPQDISAPRPAHCIHWRVRTEGWIPAYRKKAWMNSDAFVYTRRLVIDQKFPVHLVSEPKGGGTLRVTNTQTKDRNYCVLYWKITKNNIFKHAVCSNPLSKWKTQYSNWLVNNSCWQFDISCFFWQACCSDVVFLLQLLKGNNLYNQILNTVA